MRHGQSRRPSPPSGKRSKARESAVLPRRSMSGKIARSRIFILAAVAALGPIDIFVNAAGVSAQQAMVDHDDRTWTSVIDINLNGAYRTIKRCFPAMAEKGWGRIINIASTAAVVGYPRHSAYCAAKAALLGLARCVALEGAASGISCNAINPGLGRHRDDAARLAAPHRPGRAGSDGRRELRRDRRAPCRRNG